MARTDPHPELGVENALSGENVSNGRAQSRNEKLNYSLSPHVRHVNERV